MQYFLFGSLPPFPHAQCLGFARVFVLISAKISHPIKVISQDKMNVFTPQFSFYFEKIFTWLSFYNKAKSMKYTFHITIPSSLWRKAWVYVINQVLTNKSGVFEIWSVNVAWHMAIQGTCKEKECVLNDFLTYKVYVMSSVCFLSFIMINSEWTIDSFIHSFIQHNEWAPVMHWTLQNTVIHWWTQSLITKI